jgi:hypothetical protein
VLRNTAKGLAEPWELDGVAMSHRNPR